MPKLIVRTHRLLNRAVQTILGIPDRERRFLSGPRSAMPTPAQDPNMAYGSEAAQADVAKATRFRPTQDDLNRYEEVMGWIAWLKRQGELGAVGKDKWGDVAAKLIIYNATGHHWASICRRLKLDKSDDTARRWHGFAVETIARAYWPRILEMG